MKAEIVICAIARCENLYIKEWVDYHLGMGFTHIYIYDNNRQGEERLTDVLSTDNSYDNSVTIIPFHDVVDWPQMIAYEEFWEKFKFDYVLYIDIDEFFTFGPKWGGPKNVAAFVEFFSQKADAVLLNWMIYGDNGEIQYAPNNVIDRFPSPLPLTFSRDNMWGKQPMNGHVKTMVKHTADFTIAGPHVGRGDYVCCNADGDIVENKPWTSNPVYSNVYIRHYITKSIREFIDMKAGRGLGDRKDGTTYAFSEFFAFNKPTIRKIIIFRKACKQRGIKGKPLKWWIKLYVKHWIITPLFVR